MELKTWSPLLDLEREMPGILGRYWLAGPGEGPARLTADMHREGDKLVVTVEMPGIDPEDIEVSVEGNALLVKGEKKGEREVREEDRYLRERRYGRFERTVTLPDGVDPDSVTASYDKGVLSVEVPVPETRTEARTIPVKTGNPGPPE